ncbi:MAG: glycosyltransferase [Acidimicrobiales bacterium]
MPGLSAVEMSPLPLARFEPLIGERRFHALTEMAARAKVQLAGVTVWNVNSTAAGGGVAEMLRVLVGYCLDAGVDVRWHVISGDDTFFSVTKRLHNQLHGFPGDGAIVPADVEHYRRLTDSLGAEFAELVRPGDVVLLHDPQTAGMAAQLAAAGAHVIWRSHVGVDHQNYWTEAAWSFLRPHLEMCQAFVFSRRSYAPDWLPADAVVVIPPSIDPFSVKNRDLTTEDVVDILQRAGMLAMNDKGASASSRESATVISRRATVVGEGDSIDPDMPLVVQVSRWDRLKDMAGVMSGFVQEVAGRIDDVHLALVGPAVAAVSDDPEGADVLAQCVAAWHALPIEMRRRVSLVTLPMDDLEENAAMVNAVQRHATVVVQKSLAEGFGLTVAEAMWKARAVVASGVGGINDQVAPGTGILLDDPADLGAFGMALAGLLADPAEIERLGKAARERVLGDFVGDQHLAAYAALMEKLHLRSD